MANELPPCPVLERAFWETWTAFLPFFQWRRLLAFFERIHFTPFIRSKAIEQGKINADAF
ncbi:hypothetical protein ACE3MQ_08165 [Paenibacillus lentus]|uniref:hypothetical protein n=1 Tax=Paenibacillus lentus TaxID=1338368 RepID=UPI003647F3EE